jgi:hypothetical protein
VDLGNARVSVRDDASDRPEDPLERGDLLPELSAAIRDRLLALRLATSLLERPPGQGLVVKADLEALLPERRHHVGVGGPPAEVPGGANPEVGLDLGHRQRRARMLVDVVAHDHHPLPIHSLRGIPDPLLQRDQPVAVLSCRFEEAPVLIPAAAREGAREPRPQAIGL